MRILFASEGALWKVAKFLNLAPIRRPHRDDMSPQEISLRTEALAENNARYGRLHAMHSRLADLLDNPADMTAPGILERAKRNIAKWEDARTCSPAYVRAWRMALRSDPARGVRRVISSKAASALMQNSPFAFLLR